MTFSFRTATPRELAGALENARDYTLALFSAFAAAGYDEPVRVPPLPTVNPPLWELGHIAWFAEWYILREASSSAPDAAHGHSLLTKGDDWFDSNTIPHAARWSLGLPPAGQIKTYCHEVLDRVLDKLGRASGDDAALYPYRLALAHEDMHGEAFFYTLQTLGVELPPGLDARPPRPWAEGEIRFPGGTLTMGSADGPGFVFDNERLAHPVHVPSFVMDSTLVTNQQYAEFVADGGYEKPQFWSRAGREWLMRQEHSAPRDWVRDGRRWHCVRFGRTTSLAQHEAVRHVSLYEAQAYCMWAGRQAADRSRMGICRDGRPSGMALGRPVGMDLLAVRAVSRLRAGRLPRIFGALVRHPPGGARRILCHPQPPALAAVPQFLPARP